MPSSPSTSSTRAKRISRTAPIEIQPRAVCERCRRPVSVCFCAGITPVETRTRVLILQHPRERDVGIGTARIARLSLAGAVLRSDVDFSGDPVVTHAIASGRAHLLFPGPDALDVESAHFPEPITLVVVDGTWWQAQKLIRANPALAALPRLRLTPTAPSLYGTIRREPADHCVATIEAIAHVLGYLEGDRERFSKLLTPFADMVKRQMYFATEIASGRHHREVVARAPRDPIPALLRRRPADVVCVHGEANAWPHLHPDRTPPETVHWLARRLATGESFEAVIPPRGRLAPSTCRHVRLSPEVLAAGEAWQAFATRFAAFLRPTDVLASWGHFPLATLAADGLPLDHPRVDVRPVVGNLLRRRTGTVEESVTNMGLPEPQAWAQGRGGVRLASLCAVVEKLCAWQIQPRTG
jgi:DTW domain-containing protein